MKNKSPHCLAIPLAGLVLGYFVCGFVAQRVFAEDAPKGAASDNATALNSPFLQGTYRTGTFSIVAQKSDQTLIIAKGYTPRIEIGDARLTKKELTEYVTMLRKVREAALTGYTASIMKAHPGRIGDAARAASINAGNELGYMDATISLLQKLADALAESK